MQNVIQELQRLRRRCRTMLVVQHSSLVLAIMLLVMLVLIALDFIARLPDHFRAAQLLAGIAVLAYVVIRRVIPAIRFRPTITQLALRVERTMPQLAGYLASSIEFVRSGLNQDNSLAARTVSETETRLAGERISNIARSGLTIRNGAWGVIAIAVVIGFAAFRPDAAGTGFARLLMPYGDAAWPARTGVASLMHEVVPPSGVHPQKQALTLRSEITRGPDDQRVLAHYRLQVENEYEDWRSIVLTHQAEGIHERLVDTNAQAIEVYFETTDARTEMERIELVPPPAVRRASVDITPPAYAANIVPDMHHELGQGSDDRSVTDAPALIGSDVAMRIELNKPIPATEVASLGDDERRAWFTETLGWNDELPTPSFRVDDQRDDVWYLAWELAETTTMSLQLFDEHGLTNTDPIEFRVLGRRDRIPAVTMIDPSTDQVVLATAAVDLSANANDDVALTSLDLRAEIERGVSDASAQPSPLDDGPDDPVDEDDGLAWRHEAEIAAAAGSVDATLDLAPLGLREGDAVIVYASATDGFELRGERHDRIESSHRRLIVINELDYATQLRRQLSAVRQNAIRVEVMQAELQDDIIDDGIQPGIERAQAQIGERIAEQQETLDEIEADMNCNRLDDAQLREVIQQARDMLSFAGRASNAAAEAIEQRQSEMQQDGQPGQPGEQQQGNQQSSNQQQGNQQSGDQQSGDQQQGNQQSGDQQQGSQQSGDQQSGDQQQGNQQSGDQQQGNQQSGDQQSGEQPQGDQSSNDPRDMPEFREPAEEDRELVEQQQQVRDELADLIELLDRDEDTWVITRRIEDLVRQQQQIEAETARIANETIGQTREDLPEDLRSELDRIAEEQRQLREEARELLNDARDRAEDMEDIDPQSATGLRNAARTGEQNELEQRMDDAAEQAEQNQLQNARQQQQQARETLERMLEDIEETERARAEELLRQLASLIESIDRLISVQENELIALARALDEGQSHDGRDRAMIRLNQNTAAVATEARAAGQESRRIARTLDRAADAQGAAVVALRAQPIAHEEAVAAENRSLELLLEARELAEQLQEETEEDQTRQEREELMALYRELAERQLGIRGDTETLLDAMPLDRRNLVQSRRLGNAQERIRTELEEIRMERSDLQESLMFTHVHKMMDDWSTRVTEDLSTGDVTIDATDRQQFIADSIGRLIESIEEAMSPPDEFAQNQQQQEGGEAGGEGQQQGGNQLIPPIAELRLLRSMQQQIYDQTRTLDGRENTDDARTRSRLRELGEHQRELLDIAEEIVETMLQQ